MPNLVRTLSTVTSTVTLLSLFALSTPARAQKDPKFEYGKYEEAPKVEWKASAKVGLLLSTGNAQSGSGSLGASVSRKANGNKFSLDGGWTYAHSRMLTAADLDGNGKIDPWDLKRVDQTTANAWNVKGRYDRFFSTNNSGYLVGFALGDTPAGKQFIGGGQAGYARELYKSKHHEAVVEAGYDFSYENYVDGSSVNIHSLRLFTGYALKVTANAGLFANLEALFNLNSENVPVDQSGTMGAGAFRDTRLNFKTGLSSTFFKKLSVAISVGVKYDNVPAPRPTFKINDATVPFAAGFVPIANKTDTITEAALIYSFF
jgi:hypothetical protein